MRNIILFLCIIFIISCKQKQEENKQIPTYHLERYNDSKLKSTEFYDSVHIYHLESKERFLISEILKVCKADDNFYLLDKNQSIFKYDKSGKAMNACSRKGRGHLEYLKILDFDINETKDTIALLCLPPKIIYLDKDLNAISELKLNNFYQRLSYYKDNILLYGYQTEVLDLLEPNKNIKKVKIFPNVTNYTFNETPVFYKSNDQLLIAPCASKQIFSLDEELELSVYANIDSDGFDEAIDYYKNTPIDKQTIEDKINHSIPRVLDVSYSENRLSFVYSKLGVYTYMSYPKEFKGIVQFDFRSKRVHDKNGFWGITNSLDIEELPYSEIKTKVINPQYEGDNPKIVRSFYKNEL